MLPRVLEPEVMDTAEEALDYDSMHHDTVNRIFVDDLLQAAHDLSSGGAESRPMRVLDVGTGTALIPIELYRRPGAFEVVAIDLANEMLKLANRNIERAGLANCIRAELVDAKRLPYADGSFDWVISNSIVHHIPEPSICMAEMRRVLRPGGLWFVRDLFRPDSAEVIERIVQTYAGMDSERQQQLFRQSLHAALTVSEVRELVAPLSVPSEFVKATSDRHWTMSYRLGTPSFAS